MQSIIVVDKKECLIDRTKDGIVLILSSPMILPNKNKDIEIISRLIFKITDKIKDLKK